jgi:hypothetical protein
MRRHPWYYPTLVFWCAIVAVAAGSGQYLFAATAIVAAICYAIAAGGER